MTTSTPTLPKLGQTTDHGDGLMIENVGTRWVNHYVVRRGGRYVGEAFNGADAVALVETGRVAR
jgi:hypothetical protein